MKYNAVKYTLPAYVLGYLFNGDFEGLTDEELKNLARLDLEVSALGQGHWSMPENQESYFSRFNDLDSLGGDCYDLQYVIMKPYIPTLEGQDASIEISLKEYGLAWIEAPAQAPLDFRFYYGVGIYENPTYRQAEYCSFDWADFRRDLDIYEEFTWIDDWDSVYSYTGLSKEQFDSMPLPQKIADLANHFGSENIFGSEYNPRPYHTITGKIDLEWLESILPSGSGFDCAWEFTEFRNGKVKCSTEFHAMNSNGYYDGFMPLSFTVEIQKDSDYLSFKRVVCNENARASFYGLREYLEDAISQALEV